MKIVPLFGAGIAGKSPVVTVQRRLNCYYETREDGDKAKVVIYGTPGLKFFASAGTTDDPVRGILGTPLNLYYVTYNRFYIHDVALFPINTSSGSCSLAFNPSQVLLTDGLSGYVLTLATQSFAQISGAFPNGANTITQVSGFFVAEQPGSQQFWVSNFNDGTTWNPLAFASASSYSDNILAVDNLSGNLIIFSELHTEFWQNAGLTPQPFVPILSAANEFGLAAVFSRAHVDQTIIFLAQTREGQVQVVQLNGYNATVVSTQDLDFIINGFDITSDAIAMSYEMNRHKFYQISFPSGNRSFLYDCSTKLWSEVQTGISPSPVRHAGNFSALFGGKTVITDYAHAFLYIFSDDYFVDDTTLHLTEEVSQPIQREIITRHILSDFNRIRISLLYLDMETGVGLQNGQGNNPQVMLQYSKDNGRTWGAERWVSVGMVGQYITRVLWRRFGSTRDATFKLRMTDPVKFVITDGAIRVNERKGQ